MSMILIASAVLHWWNLSLRSPAFTVHMHACAKGGTLFTGGDIIH